MPCDPLPEGALDVILKEYVTLREEVKERLKIAFSQFAYAGAILAFAIPAGYKVANALVPDESWKAAFAVAVACLLVVVGGGFLLHIAFLNMRWVQHCGRHIRTIEQRVNKHFGCTVLGWEGYAAKEQRKSFLLCPLKPEMPDENEHYPR